MNDFTFLSPTRLVVGRDAEKETGKWIKNTAEQPCWYITTADL